ncbi:hypothetical protein [Brevundimonas sp. Root1279]|uniref:hypothetical protein n=1 Tax=Brevundimonas sp. Root1279 TaxID=1736443 RepID=UPI0006FEA561|nr:hypothetical protein [Brevundimonas sp. Root1279]KQW84049.1 hypothetical protein ASC65_05380 [Brevundimonas sp. Root1279]
MVDREFLPLRRARGDRVAAVLAEHVFGSVGVAMVVLESQTGPGVADHPGARPILADPEGDSHPVVRTADLHDQPLAAEIGVGGVIGDDSPLIGPAAQGVQAAQEQLLRIGRLMRDLDGRGATSQKKGRDGGEDGRFHGLSLPFATVSLNASRRPLTSRRA